MHLDIFPQTKCQHKSKWDSMAARLKMFEDEIRCLSDDGDLPPYRQNDASEILPLLEKAVGIAQRGEGVL